MVFVKKVGGDDEICPEMPKILTKLTQGGEQAHGLSIADDRRSYGALAVLLRPAMLSSSSSRFASIRSAVPNLR
jgi:hypothetical protein